MSGIVGILHLDGSPVDRRLLEMLTDSLTFRGPDRQEVWLDGHVGFGHTLFRTTEESEHERQPLTLDGKVWIVADARVDARRDLIAGLGSQDAKALAAATDAELLLRAYQAWGESCVEHLLGDFAFAIFDAPRRRLFCARDPIGVKSFYYAHLGDVVIFSNMLDCIRRHPAVSDKLNDLAIADFLTLESNADPATTSFADIQRLLPAHRISWSASGATLGRYWTMPIEEPIFYRRPTDYLDRFRELLREAVGDRVRGNRIGILMSGGLDSTTLAAASRDVLRERYTGFDLQAFTRTDSLNPDEQSYAGMVADSLGVPIQYYDNAAANLNHDWENASFHTPEPGLSPWDSPAYRGFWKQVESHTRVALYGEGPDNALHFEWRPYVSYLFRRGLYGRLLQDLASTLTAQRRPPFWGRFLNWVEEWRNPSQPTPLAFPVMVNPSLESRFNLRVRWEKHWHDQESPYCAHPIRPRGYASLQISLWQLVFESQDPAVTTAQVEVRYPFIDLRMLRFLLAVPPLPWCRSKYLLRRAMRDVLPLPVLRRRKGGISCAVLLERNRHNASRPIIPAPEVNRYVDLARLPDSGNKDIWVVGDILRIQILNLWLRTSYKVLQNGSRKGGFDETVSGQSETARRAEGL